MKCPVCKDVTLLMSEKNGIEIDYCPECRGIWLDRGELDEIIERAKSYDEDYRDNRRPDRDGQFTDRGKYDQGYNRKKKKSSMLSDIFEMFGGEE